MTDAAVGGSPPSDRIAVDRTVRELVLGVVQERTPPGVTVVIEGAPGVGKTFLARQVLADVPQNSATVLCVTGESGRSRDPFAVIGPLLAAGPAQPESADPGQAAFDRVDELCADGPVVLCADNAHYFDGATLTLLRRLVWASRDLPLAILITTRPVPPDEPLAALVGQARARLWLPPMSRMLVERLVYDQTGRWPGPQLRRILGLAEGNPLFVTELLRAYTDAGALAETGQDTIEARFELDLRGTGVAELIRTHLGQLDEPTRDVLAALAVWGTDIGPDDLARLLPAPARPLDDRLTRAVASGLVRREPAGTVGFAHDLFREVTYAGLPAPRRRATHQRAAQLLADAGHRPALVADHLLRAADSEGDPGLMPALREAVAATRGYAPEVTADLLGDSAADIGQDQPELLLDRVNALFLRGHGEAAETLIRERIAAVTDPAVAMQMQLIMLRSMGNRADVGAALAAFDRIAAIPGVPEPARRQMEGTRAYLLVQAGQAPDEAELDAMMARYVAAADLDAQANLLGAAASIALQAGRNSRARELLQTREKLWPVTGGFRSRSSSLFLPAMVELAESGPVAAREALDRARRVSTEGHADWVSPFLGYVAGGIAFAAGDWDGAVAELDAALEQGEETGTGWISVPVGLRSYIDAHRGLVGPARARLESFRHRRLPLQFGQDRPGLAELAVLEAEGATSEALILARALWSASRHAGWWVVELAPEVTRVALAGMDHRLSSQLAADADGFGRPDVTALVRGMIDADAEQLEAAASSFAANGLALAETIAREELACAVAAAGDRQRAAAALDAALAGYQRMGAVIDTDRALARLRALGLRRGPREAHRHIDHGWASLTATESRIAALVRDGLTNREIGTRLFVSPRTVQTHVSHILQKTGLRSRVEIARASHTSSTDTASTASTIPAKLPSGKHGVFGLVGVFRPL